MSIGLQRGRVELADHDAGWAAIAGEAIARLRQVFGPAAADIQHVGSTAIAGIKAKPIIDLAVAVADLGDVSAFLPALAAAGFLHVLENDDESQVFLRCGDAGRTFTTHHIHVVRLDGDEWRDYLLLRDYLNACPDAAMAYEAVKRRLREQYPADRDAYTEGKSAFIRRTLTEATAWAQARAQALPSQDWPPATNRQGSR